MAGALIALVANETRVRQKLIAYAMKKKMTDTATWRWLTGETVEVWEVVDEMSKLYSKAFELYFKKCGI
jgi:hypothetical protein